MEEEKAKEFIEELSAYEKRFTSMLTNVKLCSVMIDRLGKIIFINNYLLERTGWTMEEVLQNDWFSIFIPTDKKEQMKNIFEMISSGLAEVLCYIENEIVAKDGSRIMVGWNNTLLKDVNNNVVGISSIGEDLTKKPANDSVDNNASISISLEEIHSPKLIIAGSNFTGETLGEYILVKNLGGENSNVKLAVHKKTKERVAVKTLKKVAMTEQELERARREVDIMRRLTTIGNPFIIKLLDAVETPEEFHIFVEYVSAGELVALILKHKGLPEGHTHKLFLQILSAIECCHSNAIIHRDIKLQNILLDQNKDIKLIDFGLSNFMEEGVFRNTFCGTPAYASPEILLGTRYSGPEVDLWSLGVVLYSMLTSEFPFTTIGDILKGKFKEPEMVTPECIDLLKSILRVDKDTRETLSGVLNHPWIKMSSEEVESRSLALKEAFQSKRSSELTDRNQSETEEPSIKRRKSSNSMELAKGKSG